MPYLLPRAASAGCVLLLTALGPSGGTATADPAARVAASAPAPAPRAFSDSARYTVVLIPCVSGMCQVPLHGSAVPTPLKPDRPTPPPEPAPYTLASAAGER